MTVSEEELARRETARAALALARSIQEAHTAINGPLIEAEWIQKLRAIKLKEILTEAQDLESALRERSLRQIEALKSSARAISELEAETEAARACHRQVLSSILRTHEERTHDLLTRHTAALQLLQEEISKEEAAAAAARSTLSEALSHDVAAHQATHDATQKASETAHSARKREILDSWDERCGVTRLLAEERIQLQATELADVKRASAAATKDDRARYKQLLEADSKETALIESREGRLREVQAEIAEWQRRLAGDAEEWQRQVTQAKCIKSEALDKYSAAQREVGNSRKAHENKLKAVSVAR